MDRTRRKAVMTRSIKLGHCVCDPKKPCPCDVFKEHDVCMCAGERLPAKAEAVGLTQHVHKAGCASKIGQEDLLGILSRLPAVVDPAVLEQRKMAWKPPEPKITSGILARYRNSVTSASRGSVLR